RPEESAPLSAIARLDYYFRRTRGRALSQTGLQNRDHVRSIVVSASRHLRIIGPVVIGASLSTRYLSFRRAKHLKEALNDCDDPASEPGQGRHLSQLVRL